jgi:hypothetical protein
MRIAVAILLLTVAAAIGGWNKATYAIVNKPQLDAAIAEGRVNPTVLRQKLKGYPHVWLRTSNDGVWVVFESEVPGDIAYLRTRANKEGIGYTEYTADEIVNVMSGTNWTANAE